MFAGARSQTAVANWTATLERQTIINFSIQSPLLRVYGSIHWRVPPKQWMKWTNPRTARAANVIEKFQFFPRKRRAPVSIRFPKKMSNKKYWTQLWRIDDFLMKCNCFCSASFVVCDGTSAKTQKKYKSSQCLNWTFQISTEVYVKE